MDKQATESQINEYETSSTKVCSTCKRTFSGSDSKSFCPDDNGLLYISSKDSLLGSKVLDRYEIELLLGTGGWSKVYLANDCTLQQRVAVKVLQRQYASEPEKVRRFQNEARSVRELQHGNIAATFNYGLLNNGQPFLVMEYIQGKTLKEIIESHELKSFLDYMPIYEQICLGLAEAHRKGVVHRDLKPANIMITEQAGEQRIKVLDFGLAKVMMPDEEEIASLTRTGEALGTPPYMSPEQCRGSAIDARADIYSLGCMMFETITGQLPFFGSTPLDCMVKHMTDDPPPFKAVNPQLETPKGLEEVVRHCLSKAPDDRYQTVSDLFDDLQVAMGVKTGQLHKNKRISKTPSKSLVIGAVIGAAATALGAGFLLNNSKELNQNESTVPAKQGEQIASSVPDASRTGVGAIGKNSPARESLLEEIGTLNHGEPDETRLIMTCQKLLAMDENTFGKSSEQVAEDYFWLGLATFDDDSIEISLENFQACLFVLEYLHPAHPEKMLETLRWISECYKLSGDTQKASNTEQKIVDIQKKTHGVLSSEVSESKQGINQRGSALRVHPLTENLTPSVIAAIRKNDPSIPVYERLGTQLFKRSHHRRHHASNAAEE